MRLLAGQITQVVRNYQGAGVSIYAALGSTIVHRRPRIFASVPLRLGDPADYQDFPGTERVASVSDPATSDNYTLPAAWLPGPGLTAQVAFDIRRFENDIELPVPGGVQTITIDENGDPVQFLDGSAELLSTTLLEAGGVRFRVRFLPSESGIDPEELKMTRTSGPTTPADETVSFVSGTYTYEITFTSLSDASPYEFSLIAEALSGSITKTLLTGISVTVDSTGPPAINSVVQEVV